MSNTQKNWNDFWDNYEPSRNDIVYKNMNQRERYSKFGIKNIMVTFFTTIIIMLAILIPTIKKEYSEIKQQTQTKELSMSPTYNFEVPLIDNLNGKTMADNVHKINNIIKDISENMYSYTEDDFNNYLMEVKKADLAKCYSTYKKAAEKKILLARSINDNTVDTDLKNGLIEEYNNIELFDYLAEAFNKADVEYWRDETEIHYKYKE